VVVDEQLFRLASKFKQSEVLGTLYHFLICIPGLTFPACLGELTEIFAIGSPQQGVSATMSRLPDHYRLDFNGEV
jgi:hypothetical protein